MKCDKCCKVFIEREVQESHDVPKYLFKGYPNERKEQADKLGRHWLCKKCHDIYEEALQKYLRPRAKMFAGVYFGGENGDTNT